MSFFFFASDVTSAIIIDVNNTVRIIQKFPNAINRVMMAVEILKQHFIERAGRWEGDLNQKKVVKNQCFEDDGSTLARSNIGRTRIGVIGSGTDTTVANYRYLVRDFWR